MLDAIGRRRHTDRRWEYILAGNDGDEFPDYVGPEEGQPVGDDERTAALERQLEYSPFVRHVVLDGESGADIQ